MSTAGSCKALGALVRDGTPGGKAAAWSSLVRLSNAARLA